MFFTRGRKSRFDDDRSKEADQYYKSKVYRKKVENLLEILNAKAPLLRDKKLAFGVTGILISGYSSRYKETHDIKTPTRRPFSKEILEWLSENCEEVSVWSLGTREAVKERLESADLDPNLVKIIGHEEYYKAAGDRLSKPDIESISVKSLKKYPDVINRKGAVKLPSVFGIDCLFDQSHHQLFAPAFDEPEGGYIPIDPFKPISKESFEEDEVLISALQRFIEG